MSDRSASFVHDPAGSCPGCADLRREREALYDMLVTMSRQLSELKMSLMAHGAKRLMRVGIRSER